MTRFIKMNVTVFSIFKYKNDTHNLKKITQKYIIIIYDYF